MTMILPLPLLMYPVHLYRLHLHTHTTILWPFFWDHPGQPVPEENFWTLWCKRRLTEADTQTIQLGATLSGLTSAHLHHPPIFTGQMPFLPPNQQCQSTEGNNHCIITHKKIENLAGYDTATAIVNAPCPFIETNQV